MNKQWQMRKSVQLFFISLNIALGMAIQFPASTISQASPSQGDQTTQYLPMVMRSCDIPIIPNGNFESGVVDWEVGGPYVLPGDIITNGFGNPHSGTWVAALRAGFVAILEPTWASIEQEITVPSCSPYLAYWYWEEAVDIWCSRGRCLWSFVNVNGTAVRSYYLDHDSTSWVKDVIDLTDYAGQTVNLQFLVQGSVYSYPLFVVDDVAFQSKPLP